MEKRLKSNDAALLQLRDYEEIVGKLTAIYTDEAVIKVHGRPIKVFLAGEEILQKLEKFLGHKIGLLKLGHIFCIRIISGNEEHTAFYHSQDVEGV